MTVSKQEVAFFKALKCPQRDCKTQRSVPSSVQKCHQHSPTNFFNFMVNFLFLLHRKNRRHAMRHCGERSIAWSNNLIPSKEIRRIWRPLSIWRQQNFTRIDPSDNLSCGFQDQGLEVTATKIPKKLNSKMIPAQPANTPPLMSQSKKKGVL